MIMNNNDLIIIFAFSSFFNFIVLKEIKNHNHIIKNWIFLMYYILIFLNDFILQKNVKNPF